MKEEASGAFTEYLGHLETSESNAYVNSEIGWTRAMIHKVDVLK